MTPRETLAATVVPIGRTGQALKRLVWTFWFPESGGQQAGTEDLGCPGPVQVACWNRPGLCAGGQLLRSPHFLPTCPGMKAQPGQPDVLQGNPSLSICSIGVRGTENWLSPVLPLACVCLNFLRNVHLFERQ